jgi:hypothetical protein
MRVGETISHYKVLEQIGGGAWVSSTRPKTRGLADSSP